MHDILLAQGIPTYFVTIQTTLPSPAQVNVQISQILPTQIGRIYGMSLYTDTVTNDNKQLITINDAMNLYMTLKWGSSDFVQNIRLDTMIYDTIPFTTSLVPGQRYLPVNIPCDFSLDQSFYINPTSITLRTISLNLWYISKVSYNDLIKRGLIIGDTVSNRR